jgi:uncharacterized coiled-coil DUF342 family protein
MIKYNVVDQEPPLARRQRIHARIQAGQSVDVHDIYDLVRDLEQQQAEIDGYKQDYAQYIEKAEVCARTRDELMAELIKLQEQLAKFVDIIRRGP